MLDLRETACVCFKFICKFEDFATKIALLAFWSCEQRMFSTRSTQVIACVLACTSILA